MLSQFSLLCLLISFCVSVSYGLQATCNFDNVPLVGNAVTGSITLTENPASPGVTFTYNLVNAGGLDTENDVHVHRFGPSQLTDSCDSLSGHYNPILNYGELSGKWGELTPANAGSQSYTDPEVSLVGQYGIAGRGIVIHNTTGDRIACCAISFTDTSDYPTTGLTSVYGFLSTCAASGGGTAIIQFRDQANETRSQVSYNFNSIDPVPSNISVLTAGCGSATLSDITIPGTANVYGVGNNGILGRSMDVDGRCCVILARTSFPNFNNVYIPPVVEETTESTTTVVAEETTEAMMTSEQDVTPPADSSDNTPPPDQTTDTGRTSSTTSLILSMTLLTILLSL